MNNLKLRLGWSLALPVLLMGCGNPVLDHPPVSRERLRNVGTLALEPAPPPATNPTTRSAP